MGSCSTNGNCNSCNSYNNYYRRNNVQQQKCNGNNCGNNTTNSANTSTNPFQAGNTKATLGGWRRQANGAQTKDYDMGCSNVTLWGDNDGDDNVQVNNGIMTGNTMSSDEGKYEKLRDYGDVMQIGDKYYMPPSQKEMDELAKANGGCASKMWTELKGDALDNYLKLKNGDTAVIGGDKTQDSGTAVIGQDGEKPLPSFKEAEEILNKAIEEGAIESIKDPDKREEISRALSSEVAGMKSADEYNEQLTQLNDMWESLGPEESDDKFDDLIEEETDATYNQLTNAGLSVEDILALTKGDNININQDQITKLENLSRILSDGDPIKEALESNIKKAKDKRDKEIEEAKDI